jgi:8-oxo-dGTP pyrophosphatase MutT (NUDIX family)
MPTPTPERDAQPDANHAADQFPARPVTPRLAATTTLLRQGADGRVEVFLVRRHIQSDFAPDVFVFPGGSVNADDRDAERAPGLCAPVAPPADGAPDNPTALGFGLRAAALRELFEEAGVLLARRDGQALAVAGDDIARFAAHRDALNRRQTTLAAIATQEGLTLATDELVYWAHWITPTALPKRFDTYFFLAPMPSAQEAAHDALETTEGVWVAPEDALAGYARGDFPLVFATVHQLRALTGLASADDARIRFAAAPPTIMPRIVRRNGAPLILLPDEPDMEGDEAMTDARGVRL